MDKGKKGVFGDGKSGYNTKKKRGGEIFGGKTSPYANQWHCNM